MSVLRRIANYLRFLFTPRVWDKKVRRIKQGQRLFMEKIE